MIDMDNNVQLIGFYGGDTTHACSAWTSTSRDLNDEKRERIPELLKMLADNNHGTPFEKSMIHFLVTCDTASHIHLLKSRIAVSINTESARYKELKDDKFYIPEDWPDDLQRRLKEWATDLYAMYHDTFTTLVNRGYSKARAKESARFLLPYANQLTMDVSFNFRSFMLFQKLRNDEHAQLEIRTIAKKMLKLVKETGAFDASLKAFGYE